MQTTTSNVTEQISLAAERLNGVALKTPLQYISRLSEKYDCKMYFKREDMQPVRSYKIRGAYNNIIGLSDEQRSRGVVCASAGNHAQGVAFSSSKLKIKSHIFMPQVTPRQKIEKVRSFGGEWVNVVLTGTTYDEAYAASKRFAEQNNLAFIHPFDDWNTIYGQATVAKEIDDELQDFDVLVVPVGGGGLASGASLFFKEINPNVKVIGIDPEGAPKMIAALKEGKPVRLESIDTFIDGAAVKQIGDLTFRLASENIDEFLTVHEGKVCTTMIELYQNEGIITEPAGALSVAALDKLAPQLKGKKVVCVISGGNNDIARYPEVIERSLIYEGLKHYFIVEFAQKPGELRNFLNDALGPNDDIVHFQYLKKTNKEFGPALVGIELASKADLEPLLFRFRQNHINYINVNDHEMLRKYLV
ncbi:threonine ammonia-lyase IlvA [Solitalea canadensis]|uniref:L-threonine dehydratase n=1 Tax=Solitalea canadensis (strain ATCC 29591 / DSM 3403 / JCM 21819 / LMG 8368 / NBRC 15130 / NCIMB 12057 / USAM 9D) TaxID=929556 RepID=H8KQS5_SOLCM|nr:threonine ammonia-lyase IlvA [Solitalea canadensis]AFD06946.1 threonine dehydratase [Solitalea canadensis DSM 3403]